MSPPPFQSPSYNDSKYLFTRFAPSPDVDVFGNVVDAGHETWPLCVTLFDSYLSGQHREMMGLASLFMCLIFGEDFRFYVSVHNTDLIHSRRRTSKSKTATWLILHVIALGLANTVGLVTTMVSSQWTSGPVQSLMNRIYYVSDQSPALNSSFMPLACLASSKDFDTNRQLFDAVGQWTLKYRILYVISAAAFAFVGLSTDAMLVCSWLIVETLCNPRRLVDMALSKNMEAHLVCQTKLYRSDSCSSTCRLSRYVVSTG